MLAQRLTTRTLVLPPHARLREELLGLVVELGAQGVRVVDRGRVHQDHAVAVRGVVAALGQAHDVLVMGSSPTGPWWSPTLEEYVTPIRAALRKERWG